MEKQSLPLVHNFRPAQGDNPPAIIMLHGYGSDENDLFSFASHIPDKYAVISLRAPLKMAPYGNAWYTIHFNDKGIDGIFGKIIVLGNAGDTIKRHRFIQNINCRIIGA